MLYEVSTSNHSCLSLILPELSTARYSTTYTRRICSCPRSAISFFELSLPVNPQGLFGLLLFRPLDVGRLPPCHQDLTEIAHSNPLFHPYCYVRHHEDPATDAGMSLKSHRFLVYSRFGGRGYAFAILSWRGLVSNLDLLRRIIDHRHLEALMAGLRLLCALAASTTE